MRLTATVSFVVLLGMPISAQIPDTFMNLKVLRKDISRADLVATMRNIAGALGVRCTHCHVGPDDLRGMDFATDRKPAKRIARTMLRMVQTINAEYVGTLPAADAARQPVTCITCHRRSLRPPRPLHDILLATIADEGVGAATAQYRQMRTDMLGSGLYDFRELTLNTVATRLREQKQYGEALQILRLNAEFFPDSAAVHVSLGDAAVLSGDAHLARAYYRRALEIDPANPAAARGLATLKDR